MIGSYEGMHKSQSAEHRMLRIAKSRNFILHISAGCIPAPQLHSPRWLSRCSDSLSKSTSAFPESSGQVALPRGLEIDFTLERLAVQHWGWSMPDSILGH